MPRVSSAPSRALQAPNAVMLPGKVYTFCVWARLDGASPPSITVTMTMRRALGNYQVKAASAAVLTSAWQRICLGNLMEPKADTNMFYVHFGAVPATVFFDDSILTSLDVTQ